MWEVQVLSIDTIAPSSPTPHHLRSFKLSLLDQLSPRIYVRILLFYSTNGIDRVQVIHKLKTSLSETLSLFYPLAGRIKEDDDTVDCNDEGADFFEAQVNGQLGEYLDDPDPQVLDGLLPCDILRAKSGRDVLLAAQVNTFDCGRTVIGVGIFHMLADGASLAAFINAWAATARGAGEVVSPTFDSSELFPSTELLKSVKPNDVLDLRENLSTKRFVFGAPDIARLCAEGRDGSNADAGGSPTRVVAVSALIWGSLLRARGESTRASVVLHAVCMRKRMVPPLPDYSFGNLCCGAITSWVPPMGEERHEDLQHCLEGQMRDAISVIDGDYIREMQGPDGFLKAHGPLMAIKDKYSTCGMDLCIFSSWCRFPLYEVDFGWGKPIWVCVGRNDTKDTIVLMGNASGDGIEAWICLEEEVMVKFEQDQELVSFASLPTCRHMKLSEVSDEASDESRCVRYNARTDQAIRSEQAESRDPGADYERSASLGSLSITKV